MKPKGGAPDNVFVDALSKNLQVNAVHVNVAQEYIMITEDKTYRCLSEWKSMIEKRDSWIAPISLLASLCLTFVTADFKDTFGIPKDTWRAFFMGGIFFAVLWSIKSLVALLKSKGSPSVEDLIDKLKKGAVIQRTTVDALSQSVTSSN